MFDLLLLVSLKSLHIEIGCCTLLTLRPKGNLLGRGARRACAKPKANKAALAKSNAKPKKALAKAKPKAKSKAKNQSPKALAKKKAQKAVAKGKATKTNAKNTKNTKKAKKAKKAKKTERTLKTDYKNVYSRIYHRERKGGCSLEEAGISPVHSSIAT